MSVSTFSQVHLQVVFAVKGRQNLLHRSFRGEIFKYMSGIITEKGQKSIIVNGVEDHVHVFLGLRPAMRISDIVRDIKNNSTNFINDKNFLRQKFCWQEGYGVFSYSKSHVERVYNYILNQEAHHKKRTFRSEYMELLQKFEIPFEEKYLFEFYDAA